MRSHTDPAQLTLDDATLRVIDTEPAAPPTPAEVDAARLAEWTVIQRAYEAAASNPTLTQTERDGWLESARLLHHERLAARARLSHEGLALAG